MPFDIEMTSSEGFPGRGRAPQSGLEEGSRPAYGDHLVPDWISSLDGVEDRLRRGATVADVGCGRGDATLLLALAYPNSTFRGFEAHAPSVRAAREAARIAGAKNVRFEQALPHEFPGSAYDLVTTFDGRLHWGDAKRAASRIREALADDGVWMIVVPGLDESLRAIATVAGFTRFRHVADSAFHSIYEAVR